MADLTVVVPAYNEGGRIGPTLRRIIEYLDVKDNNNTNATAISCTTGCVNSNNNTNWDFGVAAPAVRQIRRNFFYFFGW